MSGARDDGGAAFPAPAQPGTDWMGNDVTSGMSLRSWFAGQAMLPTFLLALEVTKTVPGSKKYSEADLAEGAYKFADAMLAARAAITKASAQPDNGESL